MVKFNILVSAAAAAIVSTSSYGALARGIVEGLDDAPSSSSFLRQKTGLCTPDGSISPRSMYSSKRGLTQSQICASDNPFYPVPYKCTNGAGYACCGHGLGSSVEPGTGLGTCTKITTGSSISDGVVVQQNDEDNSLDISLINEIKELTKTGQLDDDDLTVNEFRSVIKSMTHAQKTAYKSLTRAEKKAFRKQKRLERKAIRKEMRAARQAEKVVGEAKVEGKCFVILCILC